MWNEHCLAVQAKRSVLYLYDLSQESIFKSFASSDNSAINEIRQVQGRRLQSVPLGVGGNHPLSVASYQQGDGNASSNLGATQAPSTISNPRTESTRAAPWNDQNHYLSGFLIDEQNCFVWGLCNPEDARQKITYHVFDLALDDRWRDRFLTSSSLYETSDCACALHDLEFDVVLPDVGLSDTISCEQPSSSSRVYFPKRPIEDMGTISEITTPARHQALDRMREWQLERISGMRRAGFTERDIADLWYRANWSLQGLAKKPDEWKTAGESMVEKSEEQYPSPNIATQDLRVKRFRQAKEGQSRILRKREEDFKAIMGEG